MVTPRQVFINQAWFFPQTRSTLQQGRHDNLARCSPWAQLYQAPVHALVPHVGRLSDPLSSFASSHPPQSPRRKPTVDNVAASEALPPFLPLVRHFKRKRLRRGGAVGLQHPHPRMRVFPEVPLDPVVDAVLVDQAVFVHSVDGHRAQLTKKKKKHVVSC